VCLTQYPCICTLTNRIEGESVTRNALVSFETPHAAETALLLSNALIVDHAIHVELYKESQLPTDTASTRVPGSEGAHLASEASPSSFPPASAHIQPQMVTIEEVDETYTQRNFGCTPDVMRVRAFCLVFFELRASS